MKSNVLHEAGRFSRPFRIDDGRAFRLKHIDPDQTGGLKSKRGTAEILARGIEQLAEMQARLYAQDRWALLLIFQAMDAAGKDGTIKHVMSGVNPQGCQVYSFKAPSHEEIDHDYLWRTMRCLPARGHIGIFNRSYYEEVLVVRVHPEILAGQRLPPALVTNASGMNASRTSTMSNATCSATASSSGSSFCTSPARSSAAAFSNASMNRTSIGSSRSPTCRSASTGKTTCALTTT